MDFVLASEIPQPKTYQVSRAEFDDILLQRAIELGVEVRQEHRVTDCSFAADAAALDFVDKA